MAPMRSTRLDVIPDPRVVRTRKDVEAAASQLLIDDGWDAVTHQRVAKLAGYSRPTIYAHWPSRTDLLVAAFLRFADVPHHAPTGDLRADLINELLTFRSAMVEYRLDRALAVLVDLTATMPELLEVRDRLVFNGERVIRELLKPRLRNAIKEEAATLMLCGAVLHSALMHGEIPGEKFIETSVDLMLRGLSG